VKIGAPVKQKPDDPARSAEHGAMQRRSAEAILSSQQPGIRVHVRPNFIDAAGFGRGVDGMVGNPIRIVRAYHGRRILPLS
jgi:hypothetical protein